MNPAVASWLMNVGKEKWSLCYSPCPRFGTLTSNNVESVNGALKKIRKLPILDCLMAIERYVGQKWASSTKTALKWELRIMEKVLRVNSSIPVRQHSESYVIIFEHVMREVPPTEFAVQLFQSRIACACGYFTDMITPCIHSLACLRKAGLLSDAHRYFGTSWTTRVCTRATHRTTLRSCHLPW